MRGIVALTGVFLLTLGCGRGSSGQGGAADSAAAPPTSEDSARRVPPASSDSSSALSDSTAMPAPAMSGMAPAKAPSTPPVRAASPAYDSAFGPSFTVDSTGKITPIVKKKP